MSRLLPSAWAIPLVTIGIAVTPPLPVLVAAPAPSRLIHASSVNTEAPRPGATPIVTYALLPLRSIALLVAGAPTVIVTVSLALSAPSFAVSLNTYVPVAEKATVVFNSNGCAMVTVPGPLTKLHVVSTSTPGRPSSVYKPVSEAAAGKVTTWSGPALAVGGRL